MASHYFGISNQWELPTRSHYQKLQKTFTGYFLRPYKELREQYEELREQYEELREQYEELRRPFSVSAEVPYTDVWTFPTVQTYPGKHCCEKPSELLEHIISASSRPGAIVLDCFAGSGSTLAAAKKLGRNYIGIEIDPHWVARSRQRLGDFSAENMSAESRLQWLELTAPKPIAPTKPHNGQLDIFDLLESSA